MTFRRTYIGSLTMGALILGSLLAAVHASAAVPTQGINLQISPLPVELSAKPGTSASADLRVRNGGTQPEKLQVRLLKVNEDDNGAVKLTAPKASDEWAQWVSFSRAVFDAPAGEWQTIHMTVAVPKSAAFGYYFAVEYTRAADEQPQPGQAAATGGVANFVLLNVDAPGAKRQAEIAAFTANHHSYEFLPASFSVKVRATGNVHVAPHGNIFISRGGEQIASLKVNGGLGNVLPGGSRYFTAEWNDGFPHYEARIDAAGQPQLDKKGRPQRSLKWDFSKANHLRFGRYTARLVMVYDDGQRDIPLGAEVSFWVIPWRFVAILFLIAAFTAIGIWVTFWRLGWLVGRRARQVRLR